MNFNNDDSDRTITTTTTTATTTGDYVLGPSLGNGNHDNGNEVTAMTATTTMLTGIPRPGEPQWLWGDHTMGDGNGNEVPWGNDDESFCSMIASGYELKNSESHWHGYPSNPPAPVPVRAGNPYPWPRVQIEADRHAGDP